MKKLTPEEIASMMEGASASPKTVPAKPKTKPKPKTRPSPFSPSKPKEHPNPRPKASYRVIKEAYEDEAHPNTRAWWDNIPETHRFSKHPNLSTHGKDLSKDSYEWSKDRIDKKGINMARLNEAFGLILQIESQHSSELEELAKQIVAEAWNFPIEKLDAMLKKPTMFDEPDPDPDEEERDDSPEDEAIASQVNKRITMNTMTQGAAVHNMMTMHHMVKRELAEIDERLLILYDAFSVGSHGQYWLIDLAGMLSNLAGARIGGAKLEEKDGEMIVQAQALVFPVLVQELNKGIMELLTYHQLSDLSSDDAQKAVRFADVEEFEPWQIQVGPELWRRFLSVANKHLDNRELSEIVMILSKASPENVEKFVGYVINKPDAAEMMLDNLLQQWDDDYADDDGDDDDDYGEDYSEDYSEDWGNDDDDDDIGRMGSGL